MIEFRPEYKIDADGREVCSKYSAYHDGDFLASVSFEIDGYYVIFSECISRTDDSFALDGVVRSALGYGANHNCFTASAPESIIESDFVDVFKRLGFKIENSCYTADIPDVLMCSCCNKGDKLCSEV